MKILSVKIEKKNYLFECSALDSMINLFSEETKIYAVKGFSFCWRLVSTLQFWKLTGYTVQVSNF